MTARSDVIGPIVSRIVVAAAALAAVLLLRQRFTVVSVVGISMAPTLQEGQRVLVRRTSPHRVSAGQLVVFAHPGRRPGAGPSSSDPPWMVKRAVAVPGDLVPPEVMRATGARPGSRVPPGRLVLLGDNPAASYDSRRLGYVDGAAVLGVVRRTLPD